MTVVTTIKTKSDQRRVGWMLFDKAFIITQLESGHVNKGGRKAKTPNIPQLFNSAELWTGLQSWPVKRESVVNHKLSQKYQNITLEHLCVTSQICRSNRQRRQQCWPYNFVTYPRILQMTSVRQAVTNSVNVTWLKTWGYVQRPLVV